MHRNLTYDPALIQRSTPFGYPGNHIKESYAADQNSEDRQHFVFWSGGCDSTLLLYELLDAYGADHVTAVSYRYPWLLGAKAKSEEDHRGIFLMKMRAKGDRYYPFNYIEMDITVREIVGSVRTHPSGLSQSCSWLLSIPVFIPEGSYVYEGGICEDDLTMYRHEYEEVFRNMCSILNKRLILRRPYAYFNKWQVVQKLMEYDLYDTTWYCEQPEKKNERCGHCVPCRTHKAALLYLANCTEGLGKFKAMQVLDELNRPTPLLMDKAVDAAPANIIMNDCKSDGKDDQTECKQDQSSQSDFHASTKTEPS